MTETSNRIEFIPYRGELEPITDVRKAEITLSKNWLEYVYSYNYKTVEGIEEIREAAFFVKKEDISLCLTAWYNDEDKEKTTHYRLELIVHGAYCEYIYAKEEPVKKIYSRLRKWMINE